MSTHTRHIIPSPQYHSPKRESMASLVWSGAAAAAVNMEESVKEEVGGTAAVRVGGACVNAFRRLCSRPFRGGSTTTTLQSARNHSGSDPASAVRYSTTGGSCVRRASITRKWLSRLRYLPARVFDIQAKTSVIAGLAAAQTKSASDTAIGIRGWAPNAPSRSTLQSSHMYEDILDNSIYYSE
ncbi:hypothetical protein Vretimale_10214, partial [Volvox reticuliferus]